MPNTSVLTIHMDSELKENAEKILDQLGITPSYLIQRIYSQIVLYQGLPFDFRILNSVPVAIGDMTQSELDAELSKGVDSLKVKRKYTDEEVNDALLTELGIGYSEKSTIMK